MLVNYLIVNSIKLLNERLFCIKNYLYLSPQKKLGAEFFNKENVNKVLDINN